MLSKTVKKWAKELQKELDENSLPQDYWYEIMIKDKYEK